MAQVVVAQGEIRQKLFLQGELDQEQRQLVAHLPHSCYRQTLMPARVLGRGAGLLLFSTALLALAVHLMASQDIPADVVDAVYPVTLSLEDGSPLLNISFSSRGIQKLTTSEEPDLDWVYQGGYSAWDYTEWHWWKGHPFDFQARGHDKPAYWESFDPVSGATPRCTPRILPGAT